MGNMLPWGKCCAETGQSAGGARQGGNACGGAESNGPRQGTHAGTGADGGPRLFHEKTSPESLRAAVAALCVGVSVVAVPPEAYGLLPLPFDPVTGMLHVICPHKLFGSLRTADVGLYVPRMQKQG